MKDTAVSYSILLLELANSSTGLVFCRVYLNRETAAAHELVFREINNLIIGDTGSGLRWRHLDANAGEDFNNGILQWTGDQGGGQAKGACCCILSERGS